MKVRIVVAALLLFILGYRIHSRVVGSFVLPERSFNFGATSDTSVVSHIFKIENTGSDSLVISDVQASCGCTSTILDKKVVAPGDTANLKVTLDPRGKGIGKIEKAIWITTSAGIDSVSVIANIKTVHPKVMIRVDNIFKGDCRTCHVDKGVGKLGKALFDADCLMCHSSSPKSHAPHLRQLIAMNVSDTALFRMIAEGKPKTNMPAYANAHGGPLTDEEIKSLVVMININHNSNEISRKNTASE
jgi:hypothetical protein